MKPAISVVCPVYNSEPFLDRLIKSVLSQTFTDFEFILVDDGSLDDSGVICDNYAKVDKRIIVIHKVNGGVSTARNRGIEEASGKYICFIDSDDWLDPSYLHNFMKVDPSIYGVVLQSFYFNYEKGKCIPCILPEGIIETSAELEYFLEYTDGVHNGFLWHKLFHLDIIKKYGIRYPENLCFAEDGLFFLKYIDHSSHFFVTSNIGYHYLIRTNSLTSKGQRLSIETSTFLVDSYIRLTSSIIKSNANNGDIINGLKRYMWNLAYGWICDRSIRTFKDYKVILPFWGRLSILHGIDTTIYGLPTLQRYIMKNMCSDVTFINYILFIIMRALWNMGARIKYLFNSFFSLIKLGCD